ncbi:MAG: transposase, partial [Thermodesulfobacteriota bacterium]
NDLFSQKAKDFGSENQQIFKALRAVNEQLKSKGIWAMDRGADRGEIVEELGKLKARFVIRARGDRKVETAMGRRLEVREIACRTRTKTKYKITIDKEGYKEDKEIRLGIRHGVQVEGVIVSIVVVRGFGKKPLMLMTNVDKEPKEILDIYLTRWKCEESFRFLKHEYHLEDVRVRSYVGLRNTIAIMHAVFYFLSVYLHRGLRVNILLEKILEKAKRFFEVPVFKHYAIADGIYRLLFNKKWIEENDEEGPENNRQLLLEF